MEREVAALPELEPGSVAEIGSRLRANVRRAVKVDDRVVGDLLVALLAEGHVLIEDFPGVGKTALARALARSIEAEYARVQCTADLLPADLVGTNVFDSRAGRFEFHPGPVFANVVLVDEINRASPKTQSGLLECMQERRITIDNVAHELARPFLVVATQNPVEYEGTYPLPEAQLDRFMMRVSLGYPDPGDEADMYESHAAGDRVLDIEPVADVGTILAAQAAASAIHGSDALRALRRWPSAPRPARTPGSSSEPAPVPACCCSGRPRRGPPWRAATTALPDDVQVLAPSVLAHRLLLAPGAAPEDREAAVREALERVPAL